MQRDFKLEPTLLLWMMIAGALTACRGKTPVVSEPRPVRSTLVTAAAAEQISTYTAEIRARYETELSFQVGGKLIARNAEVGASVQRGQVLAQIEASDQRVGIEAARAAVSAAQAEVERTRSEEHRYRDLFERGLTTAATYFAQQTAVRTAQARLTQAAAELKLNEQRLAYTTLRADTDGVITRVMAEAGAVVAAGQRVLSIAQPNELEAVFDVPDGRIADVRAAAAVHLSLLNAPEVRYPARVREISPSADPVTRTYQVKTSLSAPPASLRLGMNALIGIEAATSPSAIALPATALFQRGREPAVWIIKPDLTLELRAVHVERYDSDRVLIASGVSPGERVATAGVHKLAAGEQVRLLQGVMYEHP